MTNLKKLICLLLAAVFALSATACGKGGDSSEDVEIEYVYEYESGVPGSVQGSDGTSQSTSGGGSTQTSKPSGGSSGPIASEDTLKRLRGTTVKYATWRDPDADQASAVFEKFQQEYGINVEVVFVPQTGYSSTIQGLIASGQSPDVYFSNGDFPSCLACLQPISAAKLNTSDPIWDQGVFQVTSFKGESYLCSTVGNIWNEGNCLFYNKSLWKQAGITSTPEEFAKAGKWNWDTLEQIMTAVNKLKNRAGGAIDTTFTLASVGYSMYDLVDGKFVSGIDNNGIVEAMKRISKWYQAGIISGDRDTFAAGNVGVYITNAFGLRKSGFFANSNWDDIGFYYTPDLSDTVKSTPSGTLRGWGLIRGAQNPEGAGLFMRYYLDVNNYDTSADFISPEAETFYFRLTAESQGNYSLYFTYLELIDTITGVWSPDVYGVAKLNAPDQVAAALAVYKDAVAAGAQKINDFVDKNTGVN